MLSVCSVCAQCVCSVCVCVCVCVCVLCVLSVSVCLFVCQFVCVCLCVAGEEGKKKGKLRLCHEDANDRMAVVVVHTTVTVL